MARPAQILVTATVTPAAGIGRSAVNDPVTRTAEYVRVLRALMPMVDDGATVVFAENSDADLSPFAAVAGRREGVEFLPCSMTTHPEEGKGSAEIALMWQALEHSEILRRARPDSLVWKVTGRYEVRNLARLVRTAPAVDVYINLRRKPLHWADMWVWAATRHGFDLVRPRSRVLSELILPLASAETRMYGLIQDLMNEGANVCPRLRYEPRIVGVRGFDGQSYSTPKQTAKWLARSVVRRIAPQLWI